MKMIEPGNSPRAPGSQPADSEAERRRRQLRQLDDVLWVLEELNGSDCDGLPAAVEELLFCVGVRDTRGRSIAELHEQVMELQRPYLGHPPRRTPQPAAMLVVDDGAVAPKPVVKPPAGWRFV